MKVAVRWFDGYLQVFDNVTEWRAGNSLLWIRQEKQSITDPTPTERHIPLTQVRWFSPNPTDRAVLKASLEATDE
jgi:hypothetical protein